MSDSPTERPASGSDRTLSEEVAAALAAMTPEQHERWSMLWARAIAEVLRELRREVTADGENGRPLNDELGYPLKRHDIEETHRMEPKPGAQARQFYSTTEIVQMTGCSRQHIVNCINRGELPAVRMGRLLKVPISEFEAWKRKGIPQGKDGWQER